MTYREMLEAARGIAQKAVDESRGMTTAERKSFDDLMAKAAVLKTQIEESEERFRQLGALPDPSGSKAGQVLSFKGLAGRLKSRMAERGGFNVKALIATGSTVTTAQTLTSPVTQAKPATGLLDLLPVRFIEDGDEYSYLTQTTRTNNAAPVAVGALKPTSVYTLERVNRKLEVIAHLTEPIPQYWLSDNDSLSQFVEGELAHGLQLAVEGQVLSGTGVSPNLLGLLTVSGIQTQAFNTSMILTVRSAITKVEVLGYTANGLVLNPLDWEAIETSADGEDRFFMTPDGNPVDRAARRLWGVPVALSTQVDQGTAVLLSQDANGDPAAKVVADRNLNLAWGTVADDFARNQVRARFEGRFGVEVFRPTGIVEIDLAA